jgi:colanic acid/amylovoran biosynthesis glycosyltransferase
MEDAPNRDANPRICYLYTTFPLMSETFLQREMRVMRLQPAQLRLYTIWGGKEQFEGQPVHRFRMWELLSVVYWLPYWWIQKPAAMKRFWIALFRHPPRYMKNLLETLLGYAFALVRARQIEAWGPQWTHAVWATMPATAAWMLQQLIGIRFSMGGHAYDIFQQGGDCFLREKLATASFIHTSTRFAKNHLHQCGADPARVHLIRRGLSSFPPLNAVRKTLDTIHFLSIGRLVEKKGYDEQLLIYRDLRKRSIPFHVEIVGDGPLMSELKRLIADYDLEDQVNLVGEVQHEGIQTHYERADFFIFTGKVAENGDRNGLANVIPEALARGIPVLTTPDSGILENFQTGQELVILPIRPIEAWVQTIKELAQRSEQREALATRGREWVERNFNARHNTARLFRLMLEHMTDASTPTGQSTQT